MISHDIPYFVLMWIMAISQAKSYTNQSKSGYSSMVFDDAFEETRAVLATECSDLAGTEYEKEPVIKWNYFYPHLKPN